MLASIVHFRKLDLSGVHRPKKKLLAIMLSFHLGGWASGICKTNILIIGILEIRPAVHNSVHDFGSGWYVGCFNLNVAVIDFLKREVYFIAVSYLS